MGNYGIAVLPNDCRLSHKPHMSHSWQTGFFRKRTVECPGIPEDTKYMFKTDEEIVNDVLVKAGLDSPFEPEDRIYPCSEERCEECKDAEPAEPKPHRHFFKLTRMIRRIDSVGRFDFAVSRNEIAWQCECSKYHIEDRIHLKEEMVPSWAEVEQTWPS